MLWGQIGVGSKLWAQPCLWLILFVLWPQLSGKKVANASVLHFYDR